jgi:CoA:oxalate CoA-transferase
MRNSVLSGIRVLDFTSVMAGPFCTRLLADLGAEVIKVEPPEGDHIRGRPPLRDGPGGAHSSYFGQLNCGKRSIVLDLKKPDAVAAARRLAAVADVVVENFRPGVMARFGLDHETLAPDNPRLVYCSISGYGQTGPSADRPAYAPILHAASGYDLTNLNYQDERDRPAKTGMFIADVMGGVYAFGAIQSALLHRERTGVGQAIDVSLLDGMLALQVFEVQEAQFPADRRRPLYQPLRAIDGYVIVAPVSQRIFERVTAALGRPDLLADPRFHTQPEREHHWDELMRQVERWTRERTALDCERAMLAAGVPCSRYLTVAEALRDPQLAHRGSLAEVSDRAGGFLVPNAPFQFSASPVGAGDSVPGLGADGERVMAETAGCDALEIEALLASGALGRAGTEREGTADAHR